MSTTSCPQAVIYSVSGLIGTTIFAILGYPSILYYFFTPALILLFYIASPVCLYLLVRIVCGRSDYSVFVKIAIFAGFILSGTIVFFLVVVDKSRWLNSFYQPQGGLPGIILGILPFAICMLGSFIMICIQFAIIMYAVYER
jgi:hypothetical protein